MTLMSNEFERPSRVAATTHCAVIVPCFNEEVRLDVAAYTRFLNSSTTVHMIFVDDGSQDNTLDLLLKIKASCPHKVTVLQLSDNLGKGEAVRQGLVYASRKSYSYIGYWDADLATPLDVIEDFLKTARKLRNLHAVLGSRRALLGHRINRLPCRKCLSFVCSLLARLAVGLPVKDTQCGAKLFRNTTAVRNALDVPFTSGWLFDVELLGRIVRNAPTPQHSLYEMPLREWNEVAGSKVSTVDVIKCAFRMVALICQMRFGSLGTKVNGPTQVSARVVGIKPKVVEELSA